MNINWTIVIYNNKCYKENRPILISQWNQLVINLICDITVPIAIWDYVSWLTNNPELENV